MSFGTTAQFGLGEVGPVDLHRTIPFDYSFTFELTGEEKLISKTVTVSIEGAFTAVSIGYGAIPDLERIEFGPEQLGDLEAKSISAARVLPRVRAFPPSLGAIVKLPGPVVTGLLNARLGLIAQQATAIDEAKKQVSSGDSTPLADLDSDSQEALLGQPRDLTLGTLLRALARRLGEESFSELGEIGPKTQAALLYGIRLSPSVAKLFLSGAGSAPLDAKQLGRLFETIGAPPDRIQFLYALYDDGSGREFQSDPVLNIAGLGIANGDRPFRYFATPITFAPRSAIRLEITEKSEFKGELHVTLHGYKTLGAAGTPTGRAGRPRRRRFR